MSPRRPSSTLLPLAFEPDSADPALPRVAATIHPEGNHGPIQDDRPGADPRAAGTLRAAEEQQAAAAGDGRLRDRPEGTPRALDGTAFRGEPGDRPDTDGERGP